MSAENNFVSTNGGSDVVKSGTGVISEPTLNTGALKDAAKALLNKGSNPAPAQGQPTTSTEQIGQPVSPIQQIPVTVKDANAAPKTAADSAEESGQKVTVTDSSGQKTEIDLLAIPDDALVKVKRNGEVVTISGKEAKEDAMRGAKFTHEMQQLRKKEEEFAGRLEQAKTLETLVTDDVALASYIFQTRPHIVEELARHMGWSKAEAAQQLASQVQQDAGVTPAAPAAQPFRIERPEELASLGEVDTLVQQRTTALEQQVLKQVQEQLGGVNTTVQEIVKQAVGEHVKAEIQQLRNANEIATFDGEIKKTVGSILDANPALKAVPNIEHLMRFEVAKMKPQTPAEMTEAFNHVAQGIVEGLDEVYKAARKTTVIDKATMEKTGIEPPVGAAPTFTRPIDYSGENGKVDFKKIAEAAKAALRAS